MSDQRKLIIYGAGDLGREILYSAREQHPDWGTPWETVAFLDDREESWGTQVEGVPVISMDELLKRDDLDSLHFISGIGSGKARKVTIGKLLAAIPKAKFATVIHRSVTIMPTSTFAEGVYIGCNAAIAIGVKMKAHSVVNFQCSIGHDVVMDTYSVASPGCVISGRAVIGEASFLGSGVVIYPGIEIGAGCSVGAGLAMSRKLKDDTNAIPKPTHMLLPAKG